LSAALATRNRRINEVQALRFGSCVQLTRHIGGGGGVVNQNGTFFHAGKGAVGTEHHSAQVVIVANTAKNNIGILDGFTRRGGMRWLL